MPKKNEYTISLKHDGPAARETSDSIAQQIEAYLRSGGQIDKIPSGVSGQTSLGEKARLAREKQAQQAFLPESPMTDSVSDDEHAEAETEQESEARADESIG